MAYDGIKRMLKRYLAGDPVTVQVYRLGAGTDSKGNPKQGLSLFATYTGFFQPTSGDKSLSNNKDETTRAPRLYLEIDADVQEADEVRIGGTRYRVAFTQGTGGISGFGTHKEVELTYSGASQS